MTNYEVGDETRKIVEKILSRMIIRSEFDRATIESVSGKLDHDSLVSLFKLFLKSAEDKG